MRSFAYPYGAYNRRIQVLTGMSGYDLAFTCDTDFCTVESSPLALPRIEIEGQDDLERFASKLAA